MERATESDAGCAVGAGNVDADVVGGVAATGEKRRIGRRTTGGAAIESGDRRWAVLDAWQRTRGARWLLLVGCLGVIVWYISLALKVDGNNDNDAAYYLGVARYMARTGRFEENIVWHFLGRPDSVFHRPFNYWQGLTSL